MNKKVKTFFNVFLTFVMVINTILGGLGGLGGLGDLKSPVVFAAENENTVDRQYKIYPNPHSIEYHGQDFTVSNDMNVVYESKIDSYTKDRVDEVLDIKGISSNESDKIDSDRTTFMVGVYNSEEYVDEYFAKNGLDDENILVKLDANIISIKD